MWLKVDGSQAQPFLLRKLWPEGEEALGDLRTHGKVLEGR